MNKLKRKFLDTLCDIECNIRFLCARDVSAAFKIANIFTGDRLRLDLARVNYNIDNAQEMLELCRRWTETREENDEQITAEDVNVYLRKLEFYIGKVSRLAENIWEI